MNQLQLTFNDYLSTKKEIKEIKKEYREILSENEDYQDVLAKIKELTSQKKQIELDTQMRMGYQWDRLEELKSEEKDLKQMIDDLSINELTMGKEVKVVDEYGKEFEPLFSCNFKRK